MYGIIGSTVGLSLLGVQLIKQKRMKSVEGEPITFRPKNRSITRYLVGGIIFGLGWALSGACPGPMFTLIGYGYLPVLLLVFGAFLGTMTYGVVRGKLPH